MLLLTKCNFVINNSNDTLQIIIKMGKKSVNLNIYGNYMKHSDITFKKFVKYVQKLFLQPFFSIRFFNCLYTRV